MAGLCGNGCRSPGQGALPAGYWGSGTYFLGRLGQAAPLHPVWGVLRPNRKLPTRIVPRIVTVWLLLGVDKPGPRFGAGLSSRQQKYSDVFCLCQQPFPLATRGLLGAFTCPDNRICPDHHLTARPKPCKHAPDLPVTTSQASGCSSIAAGRLAN